MLTQLNLSEEEIQRLNYERYYYPCPKIQKRMHVVYIKATQNMSNALIGSLLGIHRNSVSTYIKMYREGGFEGLCSTHYHPRTSELDQHPSLIESFNNRPVRSICEAIGRIKELTGIERKPTQVRAFMHRHGFRHRKMAAIPGKLDVEKQRQFLEESLHPMIEQAAKGKIELLFCDAAHFVLSAFLCMVWSRVRIFLKTSHGRNRINVLGAVNAVTKEVTTLINTTYVTADTIIEFMIQLKGKYAHKPIVLVLDNARYQHCNVVKEKAEQLKITLLFLPPYSPNLNIIERLWKFTRKQILYARYYDSANKFHEAVNNFFSEINQTYNPELEKLLTLKFQLFDKVANAQNCAA